MQANSINPNDPGARLAAHLGGAPSQDKPDGGAFTMVMNETLTAAKAEAAKQDGELRSAAEQLVATTFIMPLFAQLRNDPMASEMFHGGRGEAVFQQQMDQILSDRISTGAGFDLVDTVTAYFRGRPSASNGQADLLDAARSRYPSRPAEAGEVDFHG